MEATVNYNLIQEKLQKFIPNTEEYVTYWKEEFRKIIEGKWIGNYFVPGPVYFYANYWTIEAKGRFINPLIRDLEREVFNWYEEARGFSGFEKDERFHCDLNIKKQQIKDSNFTDKRVYISVREYINKFHHGNLGRPLYNNQCKNVVVISCRGSGKTKTGAGLIAHTFITDGIKDLVKFKQFKKEEEEKLGYEIPFPMKSNSVISSIDSKYSNKVVDDFFIGYDKIKGGQTYNNINYPSPFIKKYSGSLKAGSGGLTAKYEEKVNGNWTEGGSYSFIRHVTYHGNPAAANGFRSAFILDDEVGFHGNLLETFGQLKQCTEVEGDKFGVIWLTGTSGDMKKDGATHQVKKIFYNPEEYNCLVFDDIYENKNTIGCFIPRWKVLSEFKDSNGITNEKLAKEAWQNKYDEAKKAKDSSVLDMFLQNDPAVPSHAFLSFDGNKYPTVQLQERLSYLESLPKKELNQLAIKGYLECDEYGIVTFKPDLDNNLRDCDYPIEKHNKKGCVTIYKLPQDTTWLNYVGGLDPIEAEGKAHEIQSDSVASLVIVSRGMLGDEIVAEYTGREESLNDTNEIMRRLIVFYNAFTLYENNFNNFKVYMQSKNQLHYLAKTPNVLKAGVGRLDQYGLHASKEGKEEMCGYTRNWLLEKNFTGEINIKSINSIGMLKELLASGDGVNTDRESALKLCIVLKLQLSLNIKKETVKSDYFKFFERRYDKQGNLINR